MTSEISVIIPCLNEVNTIGNVISTVSEELTQAGFAYEIIVVDNGSTDGSDQVAKSHGANVIRSEARTIAGVRNAGVEIASGQVLVFLDADIVVQPFWGRAFKYVYARMLENDDFITGSPAFAPDKVHPILYSWYEAISNDMRDTHIGTGHMIISKNVFKKIGGFDQSLITNEDYYICAKAKKMGVAVLINSEMKVYHYGYPNTLIDFAKREIWHGMGDCKNWKTLLQSRVALCGIIFLLINLAMLISLAIYFPLFIILSPIVVLLACFFNLVKFGYKNIRDFIYRTIVSFIYLISRGISLPAYYIKKNKTHHWIHKKKI